MLGNPLVRFCEGWGGNLTGVPHLLDPGASPGSAIKRDISPGGATDQILSPLRGSNAFPPSTPGWRPGLQSVAASQFHSDTLRVPHLEHPVSLLNIDR